MPELPDVEVLKQYVDATSLHKRIKQVRVQSSKVLENISTQELASDLQGSSFESTGRHGKYLFLKLASGRWLALHFGMTGFLKYFKNMQKEPAHDRLLITFENGYHLAYDCQRLFGEVQIVDDIEGFLEEKQLGPDALDTEFDFAAFKEVFAGRQGMVKSTLMNQQILAGIGNVYSDEILFRAGLHPKTKVNELGENALQNLFDKIREVLPSVIEYRADPEKMPDSFLLPHRQKDGTCPKCQGKIEQIKVSGRTAYFCPKCQQKE